MESFSFIPGLSNLPVEKEILFVAQGDQFEFEFQALPATACRWDANVKPGAGGDTPFLWREVDGSSIMDVNAERGIYRIRLPKGLTDILRRGAYTVNIEQRLGSGKGMRITIFYNVVYDGNSPNPDFADTCITYSQTPFEVGG